MARPVHLADSYVNGTYCLKTINRSMSIHKEHHPADYMPATCKDCLRAQARRIKDAQQAAAALTSQAWEAVAAFVEPGVPVGLLAKVWQAGWAARDLSTRT